MTTLNNFVNNLATDSLRSILLDDNGIVAENRMAQVLAAANEALRRIYTRIGYRKGTVLVEISPGKNKYPLTKDHSMTEGYEDDLFVIDDFEEPFEATVGNIYEVRDAHGKIIPLNDSGAKFPILVQNGKTLFFPKEITKAQVLQVGYTEMAPTLTASDLTKEIPLDVSLHGAMQAYMGYYIARGTPTESAIALASSFLSEYNMILDEVTRGNVVNTSTQMTTDNFRRNGWV